MRFQKIGGYAGALGRSIERPAEMLAGMTAADADAMVLDHFGVKRVDQFKLHGQRRRLGVRAVAKIMRHLPRQPGTALRGASDHDGIGM